MFGDILSDLTAESTKKTRLGHWVTGFDRIVCAAPGQCEVFWMGVGSCTNLEPLFETGRADVSVRGEWAAGNAVGGHRTLNKTDSPFVPVSQRALAARTSTRNADRNEGAP